MNTRTQIPCSDFDTYCDLDSDFFLMKDNPRAKRRQKLQEKSIEIDEPIVKQVFYLNRIFSEESEESDLKCTQIYQKQIPNKINSQMRSSTSEFSFEEFDIEYLPTIQKNNINMIKTKELDNSKRSS